MPFKFEQRLIIASRPDHVPADHIIFNAPRPLFGTLHNDEPLVWEGEFCAGRHYAAVGPNDHYRDSWLDNNRKLAAVALVFITEDEAKAMVKPGLLESYPDLSDEDFNMVWRDLFDEYRRISHIEIQ